MIEADHGGVGTSGALLQIRRETRRSLKRVERKRARSESNFWSPECPVSISLIKPPGSLGMRNKRTRHRSQVKERVCIPASMLDARWWGCFTFTETRVFLVFVPRFKRAFVIPLLSCTCLSCRKHPSQCSLQLA